MGIFGAIAECFGKKSLADIVKNERVRAGCSYKTVFGKQKRRDYLISITDNSIETPFVVSEELGEIALRFNDICNPYEKARQIYEWVVRNISYEKSRDYSNAKDVLEKKKGLCAEEAVLYITLARCCGLKAAYASVSKDNEGKKVRHACAAVDLSGEWLLVDPAYTCFDIKHKEYSVISDAEVKRKFEEWRR